MAVDKTAEMAKQAGESFNKAVRSGKQVAQEASEASNRPFMMLPLRWERWFRGGDEKKSASLALEGC